MVVELAAGWLVVQAAKFVLAPAAEAARDGFATEVGTRLGSGAAAIVRDWVRRLTNGSPEDAERVTGEMLEHPEIGSAVRTELEQRLGVRLETGAEGIAHDGDADAFLVDAYEAILWRVAMLTAAGRRPLALEGALQGRSWCTVAVPSIARRFNSGKPLEPIEPRDLWRRPDEFTLERPLFDPPVQFYVKRAPESGCAAELEELNRRFRRDRTEGFSPPNEGPPETRWHRLDGVQPTWVVLSPDSSAYVHIAGSRSYPTDFDLDPPKYDEYPERWRGLLDLPGDLQGLAALSDGADAIVEQDREIRTQVQSLLNDRP